MALRAHPRRRGARAALATDLARRFEARARPRPLRGVYVAPGRVNLIGEHVDYNGGRCLPIALPARDVRRRRRVRDDDVVTVRSRQHANGFEGTPGASGRAGHGLAAAYAAGVLWALREDGLGRARAWTSWSTAGVPLGAGLSSSAALECAWRSAVTERGPGSTDDASELVRACMRAESDVAGAPDRGMDQTGRAVRGRGSALLLDSATGDRDRCRGTPARPAHLLVVDTRASATSSPTAATSPAPGLRASCGGPSAWTRCATSAAGPRSGRADATRCPRVRAHIHRDRAGRRAVAAARRRGLGGLRRTVRRRRTRSCATTTRSRRRSSTWSSTTARGARCPRSPDDRRRVRRLGDRPGPLADLEPVREAVVAAYDEHGWTAPVFLTAPPSAGPAGCSDALARSRSLPRCGLPGTLPRTGAWSRRTVLGGAVRNTGAVQPCSSYAATAPPHARAARGSAEGTSAIAEPPNPPPVIRAPRAPCSTAGRRATTSSSSARHLVVVPQ